MGKNGNIETGFSSQPEEKQRSPQISSYLARLKKENEETRKYQTSKSDTVFTLPPLAELLPPEERHLMVNGYLQSPINPEAIQSLAYRKRRLLTFPSGLTTEQQTEILTQIIDKQNCPQELIPLDPSKKKSRYIKPDQPPIIFTYEPESGFDPQGRKFAGELIAITITNSYIGKELIAKLKGIAQAKHFKPEMITGDFLTKTQERALSRLVNPNKPWWEIPLGSFLTEQAREMKVFYLKDNGQPALDIERLEEKTRGIKALLKKLERLKESYRPTDEGNFLAATEKLNKAGTRAHGLGSPADLVHILSTGFYSGSANKALYYSTFPNKEQALRGVTGGEFLRIHGGAWIITQLQEKAANPITKDKRTLREYVPLEDIPLVLVGNQKIRSTVLEALKLLELNKVIKSGTTEYWARKIKIPEEI